MLNGHDLKKCSYFDVLTTYYSTGKVLLILTVVCYPILHLKVILHALILNALNCNVIIPNTFDFPSKIMLHIKRLDFYRQPRKSGMVSFFKSRYKLFIHWQY